MIDKSLISQTSAAVYLLLLLYITAIGFICTVGYSMASNVNNMFTDLVLYSVHISRINMTRQFALVQELREPMYFEAFKGRRWVPSSGCTRQIE